MTDVETAARIADPELACRMLMADLLFARRAVGAALEPAAPGPAHHRRPARPARRPRWSASCAASTSTTDWLVPYYRDAHRLRRARRRVPRAARRATGGAIPTAAASPTACAASRSQISLGTQVPHAAGLAWGLKLRGDPGVVCTFIGDGATSEGDFYEAINLAGVQRVPLIVVCINNGWAISTPTEPPDRGGDVRGEGRRPRASRACGSTATTCSRCVDADARGASRARPRVTGPTLLELVTYRMGAHTNSDDPTRYVPDDELADVAGARSDRAVPRPSCDAPALWDDDVAHDAAVAAVEARLERIIDARARARGRPARRARPRHRRSRRARSPRSAPRSSRAARRRRARRRDRCRRRADGEPGDVSWRA